MDIVALCPVVQQAPRRLQGGGHHRVGALLIVPGVPERPALSPGIDTESGAADPIAVLPALRFARFEQGGATEGKRSPVRFDAAVALEVTVSKETRQFVDRALHRGGIGRVGAVRLPALLLGCGDHVASEQLDLPQVVLLVQFWLRHRDSVAVSLA